MKYPEKDLLNWLYGDSTVMEAYVMAGDGAQAPGAVVLRRVAGYHPFVIHFANLQSGGYHMGDYFKTLKEAYPVFDKRKDYADPTGNLNKAFEEYEGNYR